ncbi:hypothetical protein GEMRC1_009499 [Eukaryota sp. GEM-RC1]
MAHTSGTTWPQVYTVYKAYTHPSPTDSSNGASLPVSSGGLANLLFFSTVSSPATNSEKLSVEHSLHIHFQQSLLVLVNHHLLRRMYQSIPEKDHHDRCRPLRGLKKQLHSFIINVGYVSQSFFEYAFLAIDLFFKTNTFHLHSNQLLHLSSIASLFSTEIRSVFLFVDRTSNTQDYIGQSKVDTVPSFRVEEFAGFSHFITGLRARLKHPEDLIVVNKSSNLHFPRLKTLDLRVDSSIFPAFTEAVRWNTFITEINFGWNNIGDEGALAFAELLKFNSSITKLSLDHNSIGTVGAIALAKSLKVNSSIMEINLHYNSIGTEGATELAKSLKTNSSIIKLNLSENCIGTEGVVELAKTLKVNSSITDINLGNNTFDITGIHALSEMLKVNSTVNRIDLCCNSIRDEGAFSLAKALKVNSSITELLLSCSSIGDEGLTVLADTFKFNNSVTHIDLRNNSISDNGMVALAAALTLNSSITRILLCVNSIGDEGIVAFAKALKSNSSVTLLDLQANSITDTGVLALIEELKWNTSITHIDLQSNAITIETEELMERISHQRLSF